MTTMSMKIEAARNLLGDILKRGDVTTAGSLYRVRAVLMSLSLAIGETLDGDKLRELDAAFVAHLERASNGR